MPRLMVFVSDCHECARIAEEETHRPSAERRSLSPIEPHGTLLGVPQRKSIAVAEVSVVRISLVAVGGIVIDGILRNQRIVRRVATHRGW